jgi:four helix bundle protein
MTITSYRDLLVWQKGIVLATEVFKTAKALPYRDHQGIGLQLQRAALSIPSNVAEGWARGLGAHIPSTFVWRSEAKRSCRPTWRSASGPEC